MTRLATRCDYSNTKKNRYNVFFFVFEFLPIRILIARSSVLKFLAHFLNFFMISLLISVIYDSGDKAYQ